MAQMNLLQAINNALDIAMAENDSALCFGEDVGHFGGVFRATSGLQEKYGKARCFNTPLVEQGIIGFANGLAAQGSTPIAEIQFADYIFPAFDQIVNEAAKFRYRSGNEFDVGKLTIRSPYGGGIAGGLYHSQSPEAYFAHTPGLKVVVPRNPYQAKGLLLASIRDDNPVIFFEPKRIYNGPFDGDHNKPATGWNNHPLADVPDEYYSIPIGKANICQTGSDVTVLAYGTMVHVAAAAIEHSGIDAELIDLRSLVPLDLTTIANSVKKTGRCVVIHEATRTGGFGAELIAEVQEACFWHLLSPIERVTGWDTPYPHAFEWQYFPGQKRLAAGIRKVMEAG